MTKGKTEPACNAFRLSALPIILHEGRKEKEKKKQNHDTRPHSLLGETMIINLQRLLWHSTRAHSKLVNLTQACIGGAAARGVRVLAAVP